MTQFKDKTAKGQNANVGLLTYPMLMAADILMYDAAFVPVGEDQRQHLEITRDLAGRFNARFGEALVVPEPYIVKGAAKIMDLQDPTAKMSKTGSSPKGLIDLMQDPAQDRQEHPLRRDRHRRGDPLRRRDQARRLQPPRHPLDPLRPPVQELEASFAGRGYGDLKKEVADVVVAAIEPFQARMAELLDDPAELDRILASGAERARAVAQATMGRVRERVGLLPAGR